MNKLRFLLCVLLMAFTLCSQSQDLKHKRWLSISDGLAHNGVTSIFEDSRGYLWFGTYDGLNRYDGYGFKIFKNSVEEKIFISNRIRTITEDDQQNLWIGTDEGISIFNIDQQKFLNIYSHQLENQKLNGPIVRKILFSEKHGVAICATEGNGLAVIGKDYSFRKQISPNIDKPNESILFFDGIGLDDTTFLFSTSIGLLLFDLENETFTSVLNDQLKISKAIVKIGSNNLLATQEEGVANLTFSLENGKYIFRIDKIDLLKYRPTSIGEDFSGNLWVGTLTRGVIKIENYVKNLIEKNDRPVGVKVFNLKSRTLRISTVYFSKNSGAWVGTFNKGVYQFEINENPFQKYSKESNFSNGLSTDRILSITALDSQRVYINAHRGGVSIFDTKNQLFDPIKFNISANKLEFLGKIFMDSRGDLWVNFSDESGVYRLRKGSTEIILEEHKSLLKLAETTVRYISEDNNGHIWIGAVEGVYKIIVNRKSEILDVISINDHPFLEHKKIVNVRYIYIDNTNDLIWIGSQTEGLFRIKLEDGQELQNATIHQYIHQDNDSKSISSNFVTSILRVPKGDLWIGTERGGICKVMESDSDLTFETYSESQGLSNNVVKALIYDNGNLWIPTNVGLNKFNLVDKRFRIYRKEDGLPFEDFEYPSAKLKNGIIMLSGSDGLCCFNPSEVNDIEALPQLTFGDFKLFGKTILPNDTINNRLLLKRSLNNTEKVTLKYNENVFSIELKSLHYSNPNNHSIRYQLSPINDKWIELTSDQQEISFNALPPGDYVLKAMASNSINEWTPEKELSITVKPPFWKTGWAYFLYALFLIIAIGVGLFVLLRIQTLNHNVAIGKIEQDTIKELTASKLRFFSNISHEIKTPIALITGPVDLLIDRFRGNQEVKDKLHLIKRQSHKINQLVEQVHDFQKAEANVLKMKNSYFSLDKLINELVTDFKLKAELEDKILEVNKDEVDTYVLADKDKLEKIFNNLLSNAFKYTQTNDRIIFDYRKAGKNVLINVRDTGYGISEKDLPFIFDRFYQSEQNDTKVSGTGIGLAFSKKLVDMHFGSIVINSVLGKGSDFSIRLPIVKDQPSEKELAKEQEILSSENISTQVLLDRKVELSDLKLDSDYSSTQVFLAEDDAELRDFISDVLSKFFNVTTFSNGKKCWDAMKTDWPDLLVSDILMPEMNGFELCRRIKSEIKTSHIPVLLLTACTTIEDQIEGLEVGADRYVNKPFDIQHLIVSIAALLKSRRQLRERFQIDSPMVLEKNQHNENDVIFLDKLFEIMTDNLDNQDVELDNFAKSLYLNRTHFYQKVKALTNQTPYELMKEYRLKKAAEMLVQQKLSVSEVYTMAGFKSRTHFSKLFKEKYNVSPGKYGKGA